MSAIPQPPSPDHLAPPLSVDHDAVMRFAMRVITDLGAAMAGPLLYLGDRLGLFRALAAGTPMNPAELAAATKLKERYVREWAAAMVAAEYLEYEPASGRVRLPAEHASVLADEESPVFCGGAMQMLPDHYRLLPQVARAFREGGGVSYAAFSPDTIEGTERLFRPGYTHFLAQTWIPAMPAVERRLRQGAEVADVGCGRGQALAVLAQAFPASHFTGFDTHAEAVAYANERAAEAGLDTRLRYVVRASDDLPHTHAFDLIMTCDSLHDMHSPEACARSIAGALKPDGTWFCIEPRMDDHLENNIGPIGRLFYAVSTLQCMTCSLATGGAGYGAGMGAGNVRRVAAAAGLTSFTRLPIEHPLNQFFAIAA